MHSYWIPIAFLFGLSLDSFWIPIGFPLILYWIPIGFLLDSEDSFRIPIGFLLESWIAIRLQEESNWILLVSYWIPIAEISQDELVALRMRRVRSRRTKESRETSQDEFIP